MFLDSSGPNTPIVMEKRTEQAVEQSIYYETNMVTDKVDKDMYFAGKLFFFRRKVCEFIILFKPKENLKT